jgi:hypothetical protein
MKNNMERYVPLEFLDLNNAKQVAEYEAFVQSCPKCNFSQSTMWAKVKTDWDFEAVIVRDNDGNIEGTMGVLVRQVPVFKAKMLYSPRGPVCDVHNKDVMRRLKEGVDELAKKHNAEICCSRTVVDMNAMPYECQVGLTGRTIAPKVYVAFGISGAVQHTCAIEGATKIIAVNHDKNARIFDYADYGIIKEI